MCVCALLFCDHCGGGWREKRGRSSSKWVEPAAWERRRGWGRQKKKRRRRQEVAKSQASQSRERKIAKVYFQLQKLVFFYIVCAQYPVLIRKLDKRPVELAISRGHSPP